MSNLSSTESTIDHKIYIKYTPILERLRHSFPLPLLSRKVIYIFNCEDDKYFITYATTRLYFPIDAKIDMGDLPISFFVNDNCPNINKCEFIKNNKIISIKEIKSLMPYDFNTLNSQSLSDCQILKLMELYENYLDNLIIKYMHKYGIDNVRGGSFTETILTIDQIKYIKDKFKKLNIDQINGESSIELNGHQIKLNLTTKYLNMEHIDNELEKTKLELSMLKKEYETQNMAKEVVTTDVVVTDINSTDIISNSTDEYFDISADIEVVKDEYFDINIAVKDLNTALENLNTILEDINKKSYYEEISIGTKGMSQLNFNIVKFYSTLTNFKTKDYHHLNIK
jgi:hypothetical protein